MTKLRLNSGEVELEQGDLLRVVDVDNCSENIDKNKVYKFSHHHFGNIIAVIEVNETEHIGELQRYFVAASRFEKLDYNVYNYLKDGTLIKTGDKLRFSDIEYNSEDFPEEIGNVVEYVRSNWFDSMNIFKTIDADGREDVWLRYRFEKVENEMTLTIDNSGITLEKGDKVKALKSGFCYSKDGVYTLAEDYHSNGDIDPTIRIINDNNEKSIAMARAFIKYEEPQETPAQEPFEINVGDVFETNDSNTRFEVVYVHENEVAVNMLKPEVGLMLFKKDEILEKAHPYVKPEPPQPVDKYMTVMYKDVLHIEEHPITTHAVRLNIRESQSTDEIYVVLDLPMLDELIDTLNEIKKKKGEANATTND